MVNYFIINICCCIISSTMNKNSIRKQFRSSPLPLQNEIKLITKLSLCDEFVNSRNIWIYYPTRNEVDVLAITKHFRNKTYYIPKCIGDNLAFWLYPWELVDGIYTKEPKHYWDFSKVIELYLVPWMAFTRSWYRIWRGKGYYDKYLANTNAFKVWICFETQLIPSFDVEKHDIIMDKIIYL